MVKEYSDAQQVLNDLRHILNSCARRKNILDEVVILNQGAIIERSEVPGFGKEFSIKDIASLLDNFTGSIQNTFGKSTVVKHILFLNQDLRTQGLIVYSLVFPYKNYSLVFRGKLDQEKWYPVHQGTVAGCVEKILPLIKEYDRLI